MDTYYNKLKAFFISIALCLCLSAESQESYKISTDYYSRAATMTIRASDQTGKVLKEWTDLFTDIYGPSEDSLFVAKIGAGSMYVCLDKHLDVRFVFPLNCIARGFRDGFSVFSRRTKEGAVKREGKLIFSPDFEFIYTRKDGSVVAGNSFRRGKYFRFDIKNQEGQYIGSFIFNLPIDILFKLSEISLHDTYIGCLVDNRFTAESSDEAELLFVNALQKHLLGDYLGAIKDYEEIFRNDNHHDLHESALYNYLACRSALGLENSYEEYSRSDLIDRAAIDGLFGEDARRVVLAEEQDILFKNGFGVLFSDIEPLPYKNTMKFSKIPITAFGNKILYYTSIAGESIREIPDTHYQEFKNRIYFDDIQQKTELAERIIIQKNDFISQHVPEDWQNCRGVLLVSFSEPNEIYIEVIGEDYNDIPASHSNYITDIVAFMKSICIEHKVNGLILVFPLPSSPTN